MTQDPSFPLEKAFVAHWVGHCNAAALQGRLAYTYFGIGFEPRNGFVIVSESRKKKHELI
jgi:hypothetical protein